MRRRTATATTSSPSRSSSDNRYSTACRTLAICNVITEQFVSPLMNFFLVWILEIPSFNTSVYNSTELLPVASLGRTAPGDTLQGVTPEGKKFCGQIYKK